MNKLIFPALVALCLSAVAALAGPERYLLDAEKSKVGFAVPFGPDRIRGTFPVREADIVLDFERASNSTVSVVLDVGQAQANFPFATQAMRGPKVLAADTHPDITFVSRSVAAQDGGAIVSGDITIRGVTRPIDLRADVFRPKGTELGDRAVLSVVLSGNVARSDFGATGWADLVGDTVTLDIRVQVNQAK
ncbi:MAG: YceI family protein [Rhodobacteraceae bacterium]|nr:YceI family protein [Paracoccaceae bacterium]